MDKYPLTWPAGWKRTAPNQRTRARFSKGVRKYRNDPDPAKCSSYVVQGEVTIAEGTSRVLKSLELLGATDEAIISTNLKLKLDCLPRSDQREPEDPGVAVYWAVRKHKGHKVMAIDQYDRVADNLAAIAATLEAMRAIERHGGAVILDRAFAGFEALPAPNDWRHVMGYKSEDIVSAAGAKLRFLELCKKRHPDAGGSHEAMTQLTWAYDEAKKELRGGN